MTAPIALRMAFDSGWSHGDPGDGRLRFDSPKLAKASNVIVNAKDAQDALLDELVPSWRIGDVLVIERPGADRNRVVAWVIGPITHMGPCYRVPILVRSVHGGFAAHDELALHHHRNVTDVDDAPQAPVVLPAVQAAPMVTQTALPVAAWTALPPSPVAPVALTAPTAENATHSMALAPVAPVASQPRDAEHTAHIDQLRADNAALHDLLAGLLNDPTKLYAETA